LAQIFEIKLSKNMRAVVFDGKYGLRCTNRKMIYLFVYCGIGDKKTIWLQNAIQRFYKINVCSKIILIRHGEI
jgi:hypothetical protein